jgi:hypothetical protein
VQVDPIKLTLKAPRFKRLNLQYVKLWSNFAFKLNLRHYNLVMEESAQILEIETFIPMLLQKAEDGHSRLKRVVLIGRGLHSFTSQLKLSAFLRDRGARNGCVASVKGVLEGV